MLESKIAPDIQEVIWQAMRKNDSKLTDVLKVQLSKEINTPPTEEQFIEEVQRGKGGMTGGMSGLTYNIMSKWPVSTIKLMYKALCSLMAADETPDFWKMKWLVPIPKVDMNVGREDLRPLMLIEVLRKLWYGFTGVKVWNFLEMHNLLEGNQFAYRRGRECGLCFLYMVNTVEEIQAAGASLAMSTYDLVHAYDEIS